MHLMYSKIYQLQHAVRYYNQVLTEMRKRTCPETDFSKSSIQQQLNDILHQTVVLRRWVDQI